MKTRRLWAGLAIAFLCVLIAGCTNDQEKTQGTVNKEPYSKKELLLGTYVELRIYDDGKEAVLDEAFDRIRELGDKITVNQSGSEIDEINANAGIKPVKVSDDIYTLLKRAYEYSEDSEGGFDMAIGPITEMWHIGFDDARKPSQDEIDQALKLVDYHKVILDDEEQTAYLEEKGMALDLGAIAKGYITDEVVKVMKDNGVTTAIVDLGGNVYVLGHSPRGEDEDWNVGIQDPNKARNTVVGTVKEQDMTLVTSGIYERYLKVDGETYHHLFDSETGYPFDNDIAGVTIITRKSIDGDGLSTDVFSMGVKKGLEYVEGLQDVDAIFVTKDDKVYISKDIEGNFELGEDSGYTMGDRSQLSEAE